MPPSTVHHQLEIALEYLKELDLTQHSNASSESAALKEIQSQLATVEAGQKLITQKLDLMAKEITVSQGKMPLAVKKSIQHQSETAEEHQISTWKIILAIVIFYLMSLLYSGYRGYAMAAARSNSGPAPRRMGKCHGGE
ncbi:hypothetical protein QBC44DRAFT_364226 [Cladorrhinum sp. PSN332]|nr:hypothetical protein QBC44DRAFT_364226 [Cladorrhinum sp. PSN332]